MQPVINTIYQVFSQTAAQIIKDLNYFKASNELNFIYVAFCVILYPNAWFQFR